MRLAYFTQHLAFLFTIIPHEVLDRGVAGRAVTVLRDVTFGTAKNWSDYLVIALLVVRNKMDPFPILLKRINSWELVNFEFFIFGRMGIIKSPLFKGNISTDKVDEPANSFVLLLNDSE